MTVTCGTNYCPKLEQLKVTYKKTSKRDELNGNVKEIDFVAKLQQSVNPSHFDIWLVSLFCLEGEANN